MEACPNLVPNRFAPLLWLSVSPAAASTAEPTLTNRGHMSLYNRVSRDSEARSAAPGTAHPTPITVHITVDESYDDPTMAPYRMLYAAILDRAMRDLLLARENRAWRPNVLLMAQSDRRALKAWFRGHSGPVSVSFVECCDALSLDSGTLLRQLAAQGIL